MRRRSSGEPGCYLRSQVKVRIAAAQACKSLERVAPANAPSLGRAPPLTAQFRLPEYLNLLKLVCPARPGVNACARCLVHFVELCPALTHVPGLPGCHCPGALVALQQLRRPDTPAKASPLEKLPDSSKLVRLLSTIISLVQDHPAINTFPGPALSIADASHLRRLFRFFFMQA